MVARTPNSSSLVFPPSRKFGYSGDVVTQVQCLAIFDTRTQAYATHLSPGIPARSRQIFLEGVHRGECRLPPGSGLHPQKSLQGVAQKTFVDVACPKSCESGDVHIS